MAVAPNDPLIDQPFDYDPAWDGEDQAINAALDAALADAFSGPPAELVVGAFLGIGVALVIWVF